MNKVINISSNGIKQAIDDLVDENERLQDKVYKLEDIIKEVREYIMTNGIHSDYGDKGIDDENKLLEILDKGDIK